MTTNFSCTRGVSWGVADTRCHSVGESSQLLSAADSFWPKGGTLCLTSLLFHADSLSGCPGLVHVMVSESSYEHRVCCVWKTPFPWIHPSPLASVPSFLPRSLSLEVGGVYKDIPFRAEGSKVSCSLHSVQLWVSGLIPSHHKKQLLR